MLGNELERWRCYQRKIVMKKKRGKVVTTLPKRKKRGRGKPFEAGNSWRFPKGVSGNLSGRPKLLGESYAQLLAEVDPKTGESFARLAAKKVFEYLMNGEGWAAVEYRKATEGDTVHTPDAEKILVSIDR